MSSSPITSWHVDEGEVETVADFIFLGSKITMDLDSSQKIKRHLLLERTSLWKPWTVYWKPETQFGTEVCSVKAMIFPVIIYICEIWTLRKGECQRIELLNCSVWEYSWDSFIQQGDQTSRSERKSTSDPCCLNWGIYWGSPGGKNGCFPRESA